jgi:uncharacterized protein (TIGR02145 family)
MKNYFFIFLFLSSFLNTTFKLTAQGNDLDKLLAGKSLSAPKTKEVAIGNQVWMTQNLSVDKFKNGEPILEAKSISEWLNANSKGLPAYCHYDTIADYGNYYGKLYNWYAVNDAKGLCPDGWHVPSLQDWNYLDSILGGNYRTGFKVKPKLHNIIKIRYYESGGYEEEKRQNCPNCYYWTAKQKELYPCNTCKNKGYLTEKTGKYIPKTKNKEVTNKYVSWGDSYSGESGFYAIPAGFVSNNFSFSGFGEFTYWWCSTEFDQSNSFVKGISYDSNDLLKLKGEKSSGLSVRCLKD